MANHVRPNWTTTHLIQKSLQYSHYSFLSVGCTDGIATTGGNANGACCHFPFIYKGLVYWKCTSRDAETNWCSVSKVFEIEKKWGFCLQIDNLLVAITFFCNYLPCDLQMNGTMVGAGVIRFQPSYPGLQTKKTRCVSRVLTLRQQNIYIADF